MAGVPCARNPAQRGTQGEAPSAPRGGSAARAHALDDKALHDEAAALRKRFATLSIIPGRTASLLSADAAGTQAGLSRAARLSEAADSARSASSAALLRSCAAHGRASAAVAAYGRAVAACATVDAEQVRASVAALNAATLAATANTVDRVLERLSELASAHGDLKNDVDEAERLLAELPGQ